MTNFEKWWESEWQNSFMGKKEARDAWNAALDIAIHLANNSDKSTHPSDLADKLEALKEE